MLHCTALVTDERVIMLTLIRRLIAAHRTTSSNDVIEHPTAPILAALMERAAIERLGHPAH